MGLRSPQFRINRLFGEGWARQSMFSQLHTVRGLVRRTLKDMGHSPRLSRASEPIATRLSNCHAGKKACPHFLSRLERSAKIKLSQPVKKALLDKDLILADVYTAVLDAVNYRDSKKGPPVVKSMGPKQIAALLAKRN